MAVGGGGVEDAGGRREDEWSGEGSYLGLFLAVSVTPAVTRHLVRAFISAAVVPSFYFFLHPEVVLLLSLITQHLPESAPS